MRRRRRVHGFALLSALWLLVALATLSLELSVIARQRRLVIANTIESVRAERAARSGVEHERALLAQLATSGAGAAWYEPLPIADPWRRADSLPRDTVALGADSFYTAEVVDIGALMNLNLVDEPGLTRFLSASSIDPITADALSQAVMDWRDADDFRRLRGAERDDYLKVGARELPKNGPFEEVRELRFVRGATPAVVAKIEPAVTVIGTGEVNVNKASIAVLQSVPGITPFAASIIAAARRGSRRIESLRQLMDLLPLPAREALMEDPAGAARLAFETHELEVRSTGWIAGSPIRVTETAIVARAGTMPVVTWRRIE